MNSLRKLAVVASISLVMSFVLFLLHQLVTERSQRRDSTSADIARSSADAQWLRGPVLMLSVLHKDGVTTRHYLAPERLEVDGRADTLMRKRGIYRVPSFVTKQHLAGRFVIPTKLEGEGDPSARIVSAQLFVMVADPRGLRGSPSVSVGGQAQPLEVGSVGELRGLVSSVRPVTSGADLTFELDLELEGTRSLGFGVVAKAATVRLASDWKDPSFSGARLPAERRVSAAGFEAVWQTNVFTSSVPLAGPESTLRVLVEAPTSGVDFAETVDVYTQTDRATKYGFLFIGLTFAAFFVFEVTRRLPIHPVQYGMVGLGMALFFLLLLSLVEHLPFLAAYGAAATACVGLTTFYLKHVLGGTARGLGFGALQASLYGVLLVLLRAEEYTLVLGAGTLFVLLSAAMFLTRKVDWFALAPAIPAREPHAAAGPIGCRLHPLERPLDCVEAPPYR